MANTPSNQIMPNTLRLSLLAMALIATACSRSENTQAPHSGGEANSFLTEAGNGASVTAPMQPFFLDLMKSTGGLGERIKIPAVWLFSPEGNFARSIADDEALAALGRGLGTPDSQPHNITCQRVEAAVATAGATKWNLECGGGKWVALLLTNRDVCTTCARYEDAVAKLEKDHPGIVKAKYLVLQK